MMLSIASYSYFLSVYLFIGEVIVQIFSLFFAVLFFILLN